MAIYAKFNERAQRVLSVAQKEAQAMRHPYVGTEHLLLALVAEARDDVPDLPESRTRRQAVQEDQRLLNCLRRRAPCRPTFLRSTSRASRVTKPARLSSGFNVAS